MKENVVLVDPEDTPIGLMEKQQAHVAGVLHRAFSVFVFNDHDQLLIQQRAATKYHSPNLWTNTCCSHPRDGESYIDGAHRRLMEEMGFDCDLTYKFDFIYKADVGDGLTEHELDHVFVGQYNQEPRINPIEASSYKWISLADLEKDIKSNPSHYTTWFKIILEEYLQHL